MERSCLSCRLYLTCHARHSLWNFVLEHAGWIEPGNQQRLFDTLGAHCVFYQAPPDEKKPDAEPGKD